MTFIPMNNTTEREHFYQIVNTKLSVQIYLSFKQGLVNA